MIHFDKFVLNGIKMFVAHNTMLRSLNVILNNTLFPISFASEEKILKSFGFCSKLIILLHQQFWFDG